MAINLINPNLLSAIRTGAPDQSSCITGDAAGISADGVPSFSDVLEAVISNHNQQNNKTGAQIAEDNKTVNLDEIFQKAAAAYHIPVELLKAVAKAESNFNPLAESHAGAQGIMQLMPGTAKALGVSNSFDPEQNIMGGAKYLSQQLARYDGNTVLALAAYNAGPGNVAKYNGVPPFKETQSYISKVMGYAGESITAGETADSSQRQMTIPNGSDTLGEFGYGLLNVNQDELDIRDYELLLNLYRYKMQLNILSDSDSDSSDLFRSFI